MGLKRQNFSRIRNFDTGIEGCVIDVLSAQITVRYDDGTFGFLLFKDRNLDWEIVK